MVSKATRKNNIKITLLDCDQWNSDEVEFIAKILFDLYFLSGKSQIFSNPHVFKEELLNIK